MAHKGGIFILIMGPSGVGKGSIIDKIKEKHPDFYYPISATTRAKRHMEEDGQTYHFWTKAKFKKAIEKNRFLEWALVHQEYHYGTLKAPVFDALKEGQTVLREVDVQGFHSIRKLMKGKRLLTIFIAPPSFEVLKDRIMRREAMDDDELQKRLASAEKELKIAGECDYIVINKEDKLYEAIAEVENIIAG